MTMGMRKVLLNLSGLTGLIVIAVLTVSGCFSDARVRNAEKMLEGTVATLPFPAGATLLGETGIIGALDCGPVAFRDQLGTCCAYASYLRAYGFETPADLALDRYAQQFEAMGWKIESQTDSNRFLIRGENEAVDIATYPMSGWYVSKLDPNNRRDEFLTVLHLRLFTALPQREGC